MAAMARDSSNPPLLVKVSRYTDVDESYEVMAISQVG